MVSHRCFQGFEEMNPQCLDNDPVTLCWFRYRLVSGLSLSLKQAPKQERLIEIQVSCCYLHSDQYTCGTTTCNLWVFAKSYDF